MWLRGFGGRGTGAKTTVLMPGGDLDPRRFYEPSAARLRYEWRKMRGKSNILMSRCSNHRCSAHHIGLSNCLMRRMILVRKTGGIREMRGNWQYTVFAGVGVEVQHAKRCYSVRSSRAPIQRLGSMALAIALFAFGNPGRRWSPARQPFSAHAE
jgi:hypothetical protein